MVGDLVALATVLPTGSLIVVGWNGAVDDEARDEVVARHRMDGPEPDLERAVVAVLDALRPGDVVAYGEVAAEAGWPGRSRAVGRILSTSGGAHPWWRVVNASGRLVPGHEEEQARRLAEEGIEVRDGRVRADGGPTGRDRRPAW